MKPTLLDLFCGEGGCSMGYSRAGFECVGVDSRAMPLYPFRFVQSDAFEFAAEHGHEFDVIHASPPCQGYSRMRHLPWLAGKTYPLLIERTRIALHATGRLWVIENVADAYSHMWGSVRLCGTMFGLKCYRHRLFQCSSLLMQPHHPRHTKRLGATALLESRRAVAPDGWVSVVGKAKREVIEAARAAFGVPWMSPAGVSQAIPPAYTEYLGRQLIQLLAREEVAA